MSKILNTTAAVAMFAFAGMGSAQAHAVNHHKHHHSGYAAAAYSQAPRASWRWYAPVRSVRGRACGLPGSASDMPDSRCSNAWRIND
jgi:hypothetical protein